MSKGVKWGGVGRDPEKLRANKKRYVLLHPDRVKARNVARNKAIAELPWKHPVKVRIRERNLARYYRNKSLQEGPKPVKPHKRKTRHFLTVKMRPYGLVAEDYVRMLEEQKDCCAICERPERETSKFGKVKYLAVDHCHKTNRVRGLLCGSCNKGLGSFEDDPERLRRAIAYLNRA